MIIGHEERTSGGFKWRLERSVQCPYCKNPDISGCLKWFEPEKEMVRCYECSCQAVFSSPGSTVSRVEFDGMADPERASEEPKWRKAFSRHGDRD